MPLQCCSLRTVSARWNCLAGAAILCSKGILCAGSSVMSRTTDERTRSRCNRRTRQSLRRPGLCDRGTRSSFPLRRPSRTPLACSNNWRARGQPAGLGLDVVFFCCAERAVPEQIFSAMDIFRITIDQRSKRHAGIDAGSRQIPSAARVRRPGQRRRSVPSSMGPPLLETHRPLCVGAPGTRGRNFSR